MTYLVWDAQADRIHFLTTFATIEEAANEVERDLKESHFEYPTHAELHIMRAEINPDNPNEINKHAAARITIKQNAWLHVVTAGGIIDLVLPKRAFKKPLPAMSKVVIWDFTHHQRADAQEYTSVEAAAHTIAQNINRYRTESVLGLFERKTLAQLRLAHQDHLLMEDAQYTVTIEKKAWLSYECDGFKDRILLPITRRAVKRRSHKQKTTQ